MYKPFDLSYYKESPDQVFTEAVFVDGKKRVKPLEENFKIVRDILLNEIKTKGDKFNPQNYWKNPAWKDLEDNLNKIFGFRYASIQPFREKYSSKEKMFESKQLNACVWSEKRFPIDGLVTEKGFYDSTHSTRIDIYITLGLIKELEPEELLAVLLHEFGHAIDPALVDISYAETNILSKYLTDRRKEINRSEKKVIKEQEEINKWKPGILTFFTKLVPTAVKGTLSFGIFGNKDKKDKKAIDKIEKTLKADKDKFDRVHMQEAYADNYARMYGYGPQLARGLSKLDKSMDDQINNWAKRENMRRNIVVSVTQAMINDVHKTDIHRLRAMIKEMKKDLDDPNIPDKVKEQMKEDIHEIELVIDEYCNNRSEFRNRVNKMINDELIAAEEAESKHPEKTGTLETTPKKKAAFKESVDGDRLISVDGRLAPIETFNEEHMEIADDDIIPVLEAFEPAAPRKLNDKDLKAAVQSFRHSNGDTNSFSLFGDPNKDKVDAPDYDSVKVKIFGKEFTLEVGFADMKNDHKIFDYQKDSFNDFFSKLPTSLTDSKLLMYHISKFHKADVDAALASSNPDDVPFQFVTPRAFWVPTKMSDGKHAVMLMCDYKYDTDGITLFYFDEGYRVAFFPPNTEREMMIYTPSVLFAKKKEPAKTLNVESSINEATDSFRKHKATKKFSSFEAINNYRDSKPSKLKSQLQSFIFGKKKDEKKSDQNEDNSPKGPSEDQIKSAVKKVFDKYLEPLRANGIEFSKDAAAEDDIRGNKIGGTPYWPKSKVSEYPKNDDDVLELICQANLEKLPKLEGYPTKGILQVFLDHSDIWDADGSCKVIYWEDTSEEPASEDELPKVNGDDYTAIDHPCSFKGELKSSMPSIDDIDWDLEKEVWNEIFKELGYPDRNNVPKDVDDKVWDIAWHAAEHPYGSKIGGAPAYTQNGGIMNGDEVQLFQFDSDLGMMWGDCGIAHVFIKETDLKKKDFKHTSFYWDCC